MKSTMSDRLRRIAERYPIDEQLTFGLDVGIASIGSAAVHTSAEPPVLFAGSRCFEAPEEPKTKKLRNQTRREKRLLRRVTRRRAQRMADIRALLVETGILTSADPAALHNRGKNKPAIDPWRTRPQALDRILTDDEFAVAILHIAKHRGFKSNKKTDRGQNAPDDGKKMLSAISVNKSLLARYETVGKMVANDEKFRQNKRNKAGEYSHTHERGDLKSEARTIFRKQRELGNVKATTVLEERYIAIAFYQRPLQDSEHLVGPCPFEPEERRAPHHAPSFEKFRFLSKLNTIRIREPNGTLRRLTGEELNKAIADFGQSSKSISWNALARKIGLSNGTAFEGVEEERAEKDVARSSGCAAGTNTLYRRLGPAAWNLFRDNAELLDSIAAVIAFREDIDNIEKGLRQLCNLDPNVHDALMKAVREGDFSTFKGAGHISTKAARTILPHLLEGMVYSQACAAAGYDHSLSRRVGIEDIRNAVVQRSLREAVKQVETLIHEFGKRPARIVVELARDVGKSAEERDGIKKGIDKRNSEKERHRAEMKTLLALDKDPSDVDLCRFELWKEQNKKCIYTDQHISPEDILSSNNVCQIDHILPRSRSHDNSYVNKVLCLTSANQDKRQHTPWEWKGKSDPEWWETFEARVRSLKIKGFKKRNLLIRDFDERAPRFVERNLNDTRYASRALLNALRDLYDDKKEPDPASEGYLGNQTRRLYARPGAITAILRRAWGLEKFKNRSDDRHHALDALICAAARSEMLLNALTRQYQKLEHENRGKWTPTVELPWEDFRVDARNAFENVFVSRSEKRRARGQGHDSTIYRIGVEDGHKVIYERKAIKDLTKSDLQHLRDADGRNKVMAETLAAWIENGKPQDSLPKSPKGDTIRKVRLKRNRTSGFDLNGGHVDNSDMVRVDVFSKPDRRGNEQFYLIPIYRHQVMNPSTWPEPPDQAITRRKSETEWTRIGDDYAFRFSLYSDTYVKVVKSNGKIIEGYYRSTDRNTGAISLSTHNCRLSLTRGIGVKTLLSFHKFHIDRLGKKHAVARETRTWHGVVCT